MPYLHKDLARGDVVATPTQEMPFKTAIYTEGKILEERFFPTRPEAEVYIVDTLKGFNKQIEDEKSLKPPRVGGNLLAI